MEENFRGIVEAYGLFCWLVHCGNVWAVKAKIGRALSGIVCNQPGGFKPLSLPKVLQMLLERGCICKAVWTKFFFLIHTCHQLQRKWLRVSEQSYHIWEYGPSCSRGKGMGKVFFITVSKSCILEICLDRGPRSLPSLPCFQELGVIMG